jgi:hypothetical protein
MDLHGQIMNLRERQVPAGMDFYMLGHRDARHAAAELALKADAKRDELLALLSKALTGMLDRYTGLVNCGDYGNWDPETEECVQAARAALATLKSQ